tara:strand:- start:2659 stop:2988 length:330 start_codon:yes stop_codon:yes gene_type:complete
MTKEIAKSLYNKATEVAFKYSQTDRSNNFSGETFTVHQIEPLSAQAALVTFEKSSGKLGLAHFIHVNMPSKPFWTYYFLGSQHLINLDKIPDKYHEVEIHNFKLNFGKE